MTSSASTGRTQVFYSSFPTNQPGAVEVHYKYMFALEERDGMFFQLSIRPGDGGGLYFPLLVKCFKPQLLSLFQYGNVILEDCEEVLGEYFNS